MNCDKASLRDILSYIYILILNVVNQYTIRFVMIISPFKFLTASTANNSENKSESQKLQNKEDKLVKVF